jgi:hypothetical protein
MGQPTVVSTVLGKVAMKVGNSAGSLVGKRVE